MPLNRCNTQFLNLFSKEGKLEKQNKQAMLALQGMADAKI